MCACVLSRVQLFATPWTVAQQAPLSMGFPRQEYWSGLPFPPPGDLPHPETKPTSHMSPALASGFFLTSTSCEVPYAGEAPETDKRKEGTASDVHMFGPKVREVLLHAIYSLY